jgi:hypothetical protein
MHRNLTINLLNNHLTKDSVEQEAKTKMLNFITREPNCFERSCQEGHFTGGCWIESFHGKPFYSLIIKSLINGSNWVAMQMVRVICCRYL